MPFWLSKSSLPWSKDRAPWGTVIVALFFVVALNLFAQFEGGLHVDEEGTSIAMVLFNSSLIYGVAAEFFIVLSFIYLRTKKANFQRTYVSRVGILFSICTNSNRKFV